MPVGETERDSISALRGVSLPKNTTKPPFATALRLGLAIPKRCNAANVVLYSDHLTTLSGTGPTVTPLTGSAPQSLDSRARFWAPQWFHSYHIPSIDGGPCRRMRLAFRRKHPRRGLLCFSTGTWYFRVGSGVV